MCKTCEQRAESLRTHSAYEHNFYPGRGRSRITTVCNYLVFRTNTHTLSLPFPTAFWRNLHLLTGQLSTSSTGLINTITNR